MTLGLCLRPFFTFVLYILQCKCLRGVPMGPLTLGVWPSSSFTIVPSILLCKCLCGDPMGPWLLRSLYLAYIMHMSS